MIKMLLLIDDDNDDREIFYDAVKDCDPEIELFFAKDGVEAIELLIEMLVLPDVIFLDYNMPRMNGLECLKKIKTNIDTKNIPIIMYTTTGDPENKKLLLQLGADYYMQKTVKFESLCKELTRLFELLNKDVDLRTI